MVTAKQMEGFLYGVFELLSAENEVLTELAADAFGEDAYGADPKQDGPLNLRDMKWSTYEEGQYLTYDRGLVVKLNGREFQISIVRA